MKPDIKIGWLVIAVCFAICALFTVAAHADQPKLVDRIAALVPHFGSKKVELVDPQEFAVALDTACKHERECIARLAAMAILESGLSAAVSRSECLPHQCDSYLEKDGTRAFRAWGTFQQHRSTRNADVWGDDDLLVQARAARSMQLGALAECRTYRAVPVEVGMFRILSGRGCAHKFSGEDERMRVLALVRRAL